MGQYSPEQFIQTDELLELFRHLDGGGPVDREREGYALSLLVQASIFIDSLQYGVFDVRRHKDQKNLLVRLYGQAEELLSLRIRGTAAADDCAAFGSSSAGELNHFLGETRVDYTYDKLIFYVRSHNSFTT